MKKKLIIGAVCALTSFSVWAACTTNTIFINGKMMMCTTCCNYGNCTTNCF